MRVLFTTIYEYPFLQGGTERYITSVAKALSKKSVKVIVLARQSSKHSHDPKSFQNSDVEVKTVAISAFTPSILDPFLFLMRYAIALIRLAKTVDIIHLHSSVLGGLDAIFAKLLTNKPLVMHVHSYMLSDFIRLLEYKSYHHRPFFMKIAYAACKLCDKIALSLTDLIIVTSHKSFERILNKGAKTEKIRVLHNFVDTNDFKFVKRSRPSNVILYVGRLSMEKSLETLLYATNFLYQNNGDANLLIVGDGPEREKLETLATELGIRNRIQFLGVRSDIPELLRMADVLVLPSRIEGFPMVILEGMASGTVVVAANVGAIPEVVNEKTGLVFNPGDHIELAAQLHKVLNDKELADRLRENARKIIDDKFGMDKHVSSLTREYKKMVCARMHHGNFKAA